MDWGTTVHLTVPVTNDFPVDKLWLVHPTSIVPRSSITSLWSHWSALSCFHFWGFTSSEVHKWLSSRCRRHFDLRTHRITVTYVRPHTLACIVRRDRNSLILEKDAHETAVECVTDGYGCEDIYFVNRVTNRSFVEIVTLYIVSVSNPVFTVVNRSPKLLSHPILTTFWGTSIDKPRTIQNHREAGKTTRHHKPSSTTCSPG